MKGIIVDYNNSESFISLDDGSILTLPLSSFNKPIKIGDYITLSDFYNSNNHNTSNHNNISDFW